MKLTHILMGAVLLSSSVFAQDVKIDGTISRQLNLPPTYSKNARIARPQPPRAIKLLKVKLSPKAQSHFEKRLNMTNRVESQAKQLPAIKAASSAQLKMNGVPVLDQGGYGSCVTFAVTAAIDAALNKGDYISQVCQLQLGSYLSQSGYGYSGWDGSDGLSVLANLSAYGFVNKANQTKNGCGGLHAYPAQDDEIPAEGMNLEAFHPMSESMDDENVVWSPLLDIFTTLSDDSVGSSILPKVKKSLKEGDRVVFGVILLSLDQGVMGAVGKKNMPFDTWVLTPEIIEDATESSEFGAHEMVITGFDDQAVAIDKDGQKHRGLLTLRNSWGNQVGDQGNFYMSYDYFKVAVLEAHRIRLMTDY